MGDASTIYEVSKSRPSSGSENAEMSDPDEDAVRGVYEVTSPYLNSMNFLDRLYGIRRDGNTLMMGSSHVIADEKGDITIGGKRFRGTRGLWELLTRRNSNCDVMNNSDLEAYKRILELTIAHLVV